MGTLHLPALGSWSCGSGWSWSPTWSPSGSHHPPYQDGCNSGPLLSLLPPPGLMASAIYQKCKSIQLSPCFNTSGASHAPGCGLRAPGCGFACLLSSRHLPCSEPELVDTSGPGHLCCLPLGLMHTVSSEWNTHLSLLSLPPAQQ